MNKAVFITGAQMGTGYAIAEKFAKDGWDVFVTSRRGEEGSVPRKPWKRTMAFLPKAMNAIFVTNSK